MKISKGAKEIEEDVSVPAKPPGMHLAENEQWVPLQLFMVTPQGACPPDFQFLSPTNVAVS